MKPLFSLPRRYATYRALNGQDDGRWGIWLFGRLYWLCLWRKYPVWWLRRMVQ